MITTGKPREATMPKPPRMTPEDGEREALDRELDEELEDTFPASLLRLQQF
jgi:hypothetical protein